MKHIHIALVGGQPYPVYLGIKTLRPSDVILIHSEQSKSDAENIKVVLTSDESMGECSVTLLQVPTLGIAEMQKELHDCVEKIPAGVTCTANLTGGTKLWSLLLYRELADRPGAGLVYVDQNCDIYNISALQCKSVPVSIDMDTLFRLYGNKVKSYTPFAEYTKEDFDVIDRIKQLRKFNFNAYFSLAVPRTKAGTQEIQRKHGQLSDANGNTVSWNREEGWVDAEFQNRRGQYSSDLMESPHAVELFFSCHWFELQVAQMLSKWDKAKEIWLNVEFPYSTDLPKNEIDIIVNTGKRLLFVECKTQIPDNTNIDKFSKAVRNYGGMASKALFVTDAKMKTITVEKCEQNDVLHFSMEDGSEKALYTLLDSALYAINKR